MRDVAVIIPYYNGAAFIRRAVDSVLAQTVPPAEFIIVDDGSAPPQAQALRDLAAELGVSVLRKDNGGQGSARNAGVAATRAPYLCFLDQDDLFLPDHIDVLRAAVPDADAAFGWVYGDLSRADAAGRVVAPAMIRSMATHPKTSLAQMLAADMFVLPSAALISRTAFTAVDGFDPQFTGYEDDDLFLRIFRAGFGNSFIDRPVTVWCIHDDSTSYSLRMCRSRHRFLRKWAAALPGDQAAGLFPRFRKVILLDARRSLDPAHRFYAAQDELFAIAADFVGMVMASRFIDRRTKLRLWVKWARLKRRKYGLLRALSGALPAPAR